MVKAIERDRNRRYETANTLALDLERHLEHKPVAARPPTLGYITTRFVRRHRLGVSVLATAVVALVAGVTGIMRERDRAARGEAKAVAISSFLVDLFKSADPWQGGARQITVVDALAEGVKQVNAGRIADPVIASSLRRTIATVYTGLGRGAEADTLYRETLRERLARTGSGSEEAAQSWNDLGTMLTSQGKYDSAETALERALEIRRRHGGADTVMAGTLLDLADLATIKGQLARADSLAREALAIYRRTVGERDFAVAMAMGRVLSIQGTAGEWTKAESTARATVAMLPRAWARSGTRRRSRSSATSRSRSRTRESTPRRSRSGGRRCRSTLRCSAPRTPPSPPIWRTSATSITRPGSSTARSWW